MSIYSCYFKTKDHSAFRKIEFYLERIFHHNQAWAYTKVLFRFSALLTSSSDLRPIHPVYFLTRIASFFGFRCFLQFFHLLWDASTSSYNSFEYDPGIKFPSFWLNIITPSHGRLYSRFFICDDSRCPWNLGHSLIYLRFKCFQFNKYESDTKTWIP